MAFEKETGLKANMICNFLYAYKQFFDQFYPYSTEIPHGPGLYDLATLPGWDEVLQIII